VQELFLKDLLAFEEIDVVDDQNVGGANALAKCRSRALLERHPEVVAEHLRRHVDDLQAVLGRADAAVNGLEQVGLPHADPAVQK